MEQTVNWEKVYVDTLVRHTKDGGSIPLSIKFSDGKTYEIDQVLGRKRAAASKVGGTGIRYSIRIGQHRTFLFEDEGLWFVEAKTLHV
ncbi:MULTISPECIES: hypothetical protein [unclassified Butyricicoccus]|jgi:hypothetical protein|uniref:hypothetical protein n=1 Tax=unclassified Butyricicoccus TaxID=2633649 RepID=UPI000E4731AD|nr:MULTISPECIES: hypothetical protein [unclassified Butyricicoccus]RHT24009.1 hypothetical protein DW806_14115 [Butyricicoccus sp. AM32-19]RHV78992.1 hypothetical protein DXB00_14855 [Butyricicoccus sp. OF10-2]